MKNLSFTREEIKGVNYRLSKDMPVKIFYSQGHRCYRLGYYILEEVAIGRQFPHVTFNLTKNSKGYRVTDYGYAHLIFGNLLNSKIIKGYQDRLGISYDSKNGCYYIQMPLLNSIEFFTHRILELMTQIKTVADLKNRHLLK